MGKLRGPLGSSSASAGLGCDARKSALSSGPVPEPLGPAACRGAAGGGGHLWARTRLLPQPSGRCSHRPCVDAGRVARKRATSGPRPCLRSRSPQDGLPVALVSIATDAHAAGPQRRPRVRGHLCDNGSFPRYGGSDGPFPPHCDAEYPALLSEERVVAGPGGSGRASHPEEHGAWSACPLSSDSVRQTPQPTSARTPRGARFLEADPSGRAEWPARGLQKAVARGSGKRGPCLCRAFCHTLSLTHSAPPGPRPRRPSALLL